MNETKRIRVIGVVAALGLALALPAWAGSETTNISGTVLALNRDAGTIVLGEIGPWRVKGGATEVTPRTIAVTSATEFKQVKRASGAGASGWVGDFVEVGLGAWEIKKGDFVTVQVRQEGPRVTALKVEVPVPVEP